MADQKITDYTELTTPAKGDLMEIVDDPGGTPINKKLKIENLIAVILDRSRPNVTVTNTASETDVFTISVAGNTLGSTGRLRLTLLGGKVKNGGGTDNAMTMRVKYGSTTVATISVPGVSTDNAATRPCDLEVDLWNDNATNAQICHARCVAGTNDGSGATIAIARGTASEDSTASKTFKVTWQQAAVPEHSYTSHQAKLTLE